MKNQGVLLNSAITNEKVRRNTKDDRDADITSIFNMFDKNKDGKLMNEEIGSFLEAIGREPKQEEIQNIISKADTDKNGYITIDEFLAYMDEVYVLKPDQIDDLIAAFKLFDLDNSGIISREEFTNILTKFGYANFTPKEIDDIFDMIDSDQDGNINYAEFIDMWKYQ